MSISSREMAEPLPTTDPSITIWNPIIIIIIINKHQNYRVLEIIKISIRTIKHPLEFTEEV